MEAPRAASPSPSRSPSPDAGIAGTGIERWGRDAAGRRAIFVGEDHADPATMARLIRLVEDDHDAIAAVFLEYFLVGYVTRWVPIGFSTWRYGMDQELARLASLCKRHDIVLEGWNIKNLYGGVRGSLWRMSQVFNDQAAESLARVLEPIPIPARKGYVVFGGALHGPLLAKSEPLAGIRSYELDRMTGDFRAYGG